MMMKVLGGVGILIGIYLVLSSQNSYQLGGLSLNFADTVIKDLQGR